MIAKTRRKTRWNKRIKKRVRRGFRSPFESLTADLCCRMRDARARDKAKAREEGT